MYWEEVDSCPAEVMVMNCSIAFPLSVICYEYRSDEKHVTVLYSKVM